MAKLPWYLTMKYDSHTTEKVIYNVRIDPRYIKLMKIKYFIKRIFKNENKIIKTK